MWGEKTCFEADLKQKEIHVFHWSISWQRVKGSVTNQIDISKEKYRDSTRTQLVIHSACKDDEGEYQAVLARESNGNKRKIESNTIFLQVVGGILFCHQYFFIKRKMTNLFEIFLIFLKTFLHIIETCIISYVCTKHIHLI